MKKDIHPKYFTKATAKCACGAIFRVGSTKESLETEICSQCHPFYTGKEKIIDTLGRVEKFKQRMTKKRSYRKKTEKRAKATAKKKTAKKEEIKAGIKTGKEK